MPSNNPSVEDSLAPQDPATEAALFSWEDQLEAIASDLYRIASMLLGEGEEGVSLTEQVVTQLDLTAVTNLTEARHHARLALGAQAISLVANGDPSGLAAPAPASGPVSCIEDDDLDSVGVTPAELEQMLTGPDDHRLRDWLEGLTTTLRIIFVLRAVAGLSSAEVAGLLAADGGPEAQDWNPESVRSVFRQGLCSLASQLIQASTAR